MPKILRDIDQGERFGRLIFSGITIKKNHRILLGCHCDCGTMTWVEKYKLLKGNIHGCGCRCSILTQIIDPKLGDQYGSWTVISEATRETGIISFLCRCECGTIKHQRANLLRTGKTLRCHGCFFKFRLIPGEKYWSWTVLGGVKNDKYGQRIYEAVCNCGFIKFHRKQTLISGKSRQCANCCNESRKYGRIAQKDN